MSNETEMAGVYAAATPRPWRVDPAFPGDIQSADGLTELCTPGWDRVRMSSRDLVVPSTEEEALANAAIIVHAVNNIERLQSELAAAKEALEVARKNLAAIQKQADTANITISLPGAWTGQRRITIATAMHRIAEWSAATLSTIGGGK